MPIEDNAEMQDDFFAVGDLLDQETGEVVEPQKADDTVATGNTKTTEGGKATEVAPFEQQFFKEDGSYDATGALGFIQKAVGQYENVVDAVSKSVLPQRPAAPDTVDTREPWEIEYEKRMKYHNDLVQQRSEYRSYMQEAANNGLEGQAIFDYADRKVNESVAKEVEKWNFKNLHSRAEAEKKERDERDLQASYMPKSRANLAAVYEKTGGMEKFNDLVFGKPAAVNGEQRLSGYGVAAINMAYRLQNDASKIPTDPKAAAEHYQKWWERFTADRNNLQFVVNSALANLQLAHMKYLMRAARGAGQQQKDALRVGQKPAPSALNKPQKQNPATAPADDDPLGIMSMPDFIG